MLVCNTFTPRVHYYISLYMPVHVGQHIILSFSITSTCKLVHALLLHFIYCSLLLAVHCR